MNTIINPFTSLALKPNPPIVDQINALAGDLDLQTDNHDIDTDQYKLPHEI